MKKVLVIMMLGLFMVASFSCKTKKKCPAYSSIYKTEIKAKS